MRNLDVSKRYFFWITLLNLQNEIIHADEINLILESFKSVNKKHVWQGT